MNPFLHLAPRGSTQQQGHLAIGHRLLGQIIIDDEAVLACVTEVLSLQGSAWGLR